MLTYIRGNKQYQSQDITVDVGPGHVYSHTGQLRFRVWTNKGKTIRPHAYTSILLTPSYRATERETVQGVAKAAVKDFTRLIQEGVYKEGEILLLMADGTHKNKSNTSMTGPWFLDAQCDEEIASLLERYKMDFATVVTEDSDIFNSCLGKTDVRGKGSQFETAFNFIRHVALRNEEHGNAHVMCIDSDLKGTDGFVYRMCLGLHQGYSYLVPLYWRHKYEGRATNHLMFPLYSSVTRNVLRQPIGGEFAFNRKTLVRFTDPEKWVKGWRDFGIDMGMSITAGTSGDPIGQLSLPRKINYVGDDARMQVGDIFVQEGRSLFNGLIDLMESSHSWAADEVVIAPVVETEAIENTNMDVELSENAEIIAALHKFLVLYSSPAFQRNTVDVLNGLSDRIKEAFEEFKQNGLCSVLQWDKPKAMPQDEQSELINQLQSLNSSVFLSSEEWAKVVFACLREFQSRRGDDEEKACQTVIRGVLLCVFYLRVFSFNMETLGLPTYPDAEELLMQQMQEFSQVASDYLTGNNNQLT